MFKVGDPVRWTTSAGVRCAGTVRWIAPATDTLHITCDPKRCGCAGWGPWHVAGAAMHGVELVVGPESVEVALW